AERALRSIAIGRKNYLFAGSDAGGRRAAAVYSLIESAKLNGVNPQHYLADVLTRIADITRHDASMNCFRRTGSPLIPPALPLKLAPSPSAYCLPQLLFGPKATYLACPVIWM